jgi:hypothetical protein
MCCRIGGSDHQVPLCALVTALCTCALFLSFSLCAAVSAPPRRPSSTRGRSSWPSRPALPTCQVALTNTHAHARTHARTHAHARTCARTHRHECTYARMHSRMHGLTHAHTDPCRLCRELTHAHKDAHKLLVWRLVCTHTSRSCACETPMLRGQLIRLYVQLSICVCLAWAYVCPSLWGGAAALPVSLYETASWPSPRDIRTDTHMNRWDGSQTNRQAGRQAGRQHRLSLLGGGTATLPTLNLPAPAALPRCELH